MADWRAVARAAAQRAGIDPDIFARQINQESGFDPTARSPAGALGIAQIMPGTARGWGVDPMNPRAALAAAAQNMRRYVDQFGNYGDALRAYNAGPGNVKASHGFAETNNYVKTILGGKGGGGSGGSGGGSGGGTTTTTTTTTTPGVDNRAARAQAVLSFLQNKSADPLDFALQMRDLADVPATSHTRTTRAKQASADQSMLYGGGSTKGSEVLELIFNDGGSGYGIKNGQVVNGRQVYSDVWGGHADHVHVAAGPKTVVALGKLAQQMGLSVGENPHFGGVDPVHVPGSYHYKGEAIDVSGGTPAQMSAYARAVEHYNRTRQLPS